MAEEEIQVNVNQFLATFRCPNCGRVFKKALQKGVVSAGRGGDCPNCGVKDGQVKVGNFTVIRMNEQYEDQLRSYN